MARPVRTYPAPVGVGRGRRASPTVVLPRKQKRCQPPCPGDRGRLSAAPDPPKCLCDLPLWGSYKAGGTRRRSGQRPAVAAAASPVGGCPPGIPHHAPGMPHGAPAVPQGEAGTSQARRAGPERGHPPAPSGHTHAPRALAEARPRTAWHAAQRSWSRPALGATAPPGGPRRAAGTRGGTTTPSIAQGVQTKRRVCQARRVVSWPARSVWTASGGYGTLRVETGPHGVRGPLETSSAVVQSVRPAGPHALGPSVAGWEDMDGSAGTPPRVDRPPRLAPWPVGPQGVLCTTRSTPLRGCGPPPCHH